MDQAKKKYIPVPPVSGQWKPGQSGNPAGRPKSKPFKDALQRIIDNNPASLDLVAAALMARAHNGDVSAAVHIADRLDGKVPQAIGGTDELPGIRGFAWLDVLAEPKVIEGPVLEGSASEPQRTDTDPQDNGLAELPQVTATTTSTHEDTGF